MELKVHINKNVRIVCGVHKHTTVQDVIVSLAQSMQQTGRFYLIENIRNVSKISKCNFDSKISHVTRVMAPNEKLFTILSNQRGRLEKNEYTEFHLIRSNLTNVSNKEEIMRDLMHQIDHLRSGSESTYESNSVRRQSTSTSLAYSSCNEDEDNTTHTSTSNSEACLINTLLNEICIQKRVLDGQSTKLDELLEKIKVYEAIKDQMEMENEAYLKRLRHLESIHSLNRTKIFELEKETNESILRKEIELNELLKRQRDNYKLRLEEIFVELKLKSELVSDLQSKYELLRSSQEQTDYEVSQLNKKISESKKESLLNQSKLEYLQRNSDNLDEYLNDKKIEVEMMTNQSEEEESSITSSIDLTTTQIATSHKSNRYSNSKSIFYF